MAQTTIPSCENKESIDKQVSDLNGGESFPIVELTDKRADWFGKAFTQATNNSVPEGVDMYRVYNMGDIILVTAYKEGCFLGAARVPTSMFIMILKNTDANQANN